MGGAANSYHLKGMAADIRVLGLAAEEAASLAEQAGLTASALPAAGFCPCGRAELAGQVAGVK
ncbi:D-Ala-D-Ala carboxypeptidase family metallohydrolase [Desulforamulus profundi]|nr:D-Ala-D-Ala carboxypeptidase family metallohydrolase [Desulforamulus profundi]